MKEIRWGIAGTGAIASQFAAALVYARGARLQAVAARSPGKAAAFAARFRAGRFHESVEQLCDDPSVDVIYVATPNEAHRAHCLAAINAGKAVLCEKPFALDSEQAHEVISAARQAGVFCMEGMWMRCSPAFSGAVDLARSGILGDLALVTAQLGFANRDDGTNRLFRPPGGGALLDLGVYAVSLVHALLGVPSRVTSAAAVGSTGVDESMSALLEFPGGAQATVAASIRSELSNSAAVFGSAGRLLINAPIYFPTSFTLQRFAPVGGASGRMPGSIQRLRQTRLAQRMLDLARSTRARLKARTTSAYPHGTGLTCEAEEVMRCLRGGLLESATMTQRDTLEVMQTMDRIRQAWQSGRESGRA